MLLVGHVIGQSQSGVQRVAHCVILYDALDSSWVGSWFVLYTMVI